MTLNWMTRSLFVPILAMATLSACGDNAAPDADFSGPTGFALVSVSNPIDITPDGQTAVFNDLLGSLAGDLYFYTLSTGELKLVTQTGSPFLDFATGVSQNLRVSANYGEPVQAGVWAQATGWTVIPSSFSAGCDPQVGGAWDISTNGQVMVGTEWNNCSVQAMRWTDAGGTWTTQPLELIGASSPDSPNPANNRATVVSGDGQVAAGWAQTALADRRPAVWGPDGLGTFLTSGVTEDCPGEVLATNENGSIMAGIWCQQAFYWTLASGSVILEAGGINAIAANGNLMFGFGAKGATVWTAAAGTRSLQDIAIANGITLPPFFKMNVAKAASTDGTVVIGQGTGYPNVTVSFILKLPVSAYGL
jgi:hypothetical protein